MPLRPHRLLSVAALVAVSAVASWSVESTPVASVDNIPPAPVTDLRALNTGSDVLITWSVSADDAVSFTPFGDAIVPRSGVNGYRVYRSTQGDDTEELIGTTGPGQTEFSDVSAVSGMTYIYTVRPFDQDNETDPVIEPGSTDDLARIVALGGGAPDVVVVTRVRAQMTFDTSLDVADQEAVDQFVTDFVTLLADLLGIDPARIHVTSVREGSVIIDFEILDLADAPGEPEAATALDDLLTLVADDSVDEFATIGPVLEVLDNTTTDSVVIPQPLDGDGKVIVGWFTRSGNQVGFDDFFAFADHFGRTRLDPGFSGEFDIVPNGAVDFDDFFRFADDFGKIVVNATEIQDLLQP